MGTEVEKSRPNIRIQITNNMPEAVDEKMEVDTEQNEEGELTDDNANDETMDETSENVDPKSNDKISAEINAVFTTGINIFDKQEQAKLQERAKRFALKPDEIRSLTDQDLQNIHETLGINHKNESEVKFKTVHLLGLDEMTAEDVVEYFASYAPEGIEWIDENSCNIVWLDSISAARALHFKSKVIRGMPAREPKELFPKEFLDDVAEPELDDGQSILIKNHNRQIELQNEIGEVILPKKKQNPINSVDISEITIPIPPGYWRLGNPHPKSKCLLIRFGQITDKLPFKSEKCNKYYKKLSNPSQRNVISEIRKKELRSIFERNRELNQSKNPWGSLAKEWDKDSRFREREPIMHHLDKEDDDVQIVEVKNPKLLARLGNKRKLESDEDKPEENKDEITINPKLTSERKRIKAPRMKMYADEEEENQKRKKILMSIKKQADEIDKKDNDRDLRNMLGLTNRLIMKKDNSALEPNIDLGTRLKNRNQRMVFAVERDEVDHDYIDARQMYPDVRRELIERSHFRQSERERERERSPLLSRSVLMRSRTREVKDRLSPERPRHSNRERPQSHRSSRRRTPESTLHSDRMHSSRSTHSRRRRRSVTPDSTRGEKTRSKVAVVIKKPQKPTVASTIWSKVKKSSDTEHSSSESESESEESENSSSQGSSSSESKSESEESDGESDSSSRSSNRRVAARNPDRPGFDKSRLSHKVDHKSPLKITTANEHFTQRKLRKY